MTEYWESEISHTFNRSACSTIIPRLFNKDRTVTSTTHAGITYHVKVKAGPLSHSILKKLIQNTSKDCLALNVKPNTNLLEESIGIHDFRLGDDFLDTTPKSLSNKRKSRYIKHHQKWKTSATKENYQEHEKDKLQNRKKYLEIIFW